MPQQSCMSHQDSSSSGAHLWTKCHSYRKDSHQSGDRSNTNSIFNINNETFHQLRWVVMSLASVGFGLALIYCDCMAVAIVGMVKSEDSQQTTTRQQPVVMGHGGHNPAIPFVNSDELFSGDDQTGANQTANSDKQLSEQFFEWNNLIQSLVVNSYFLGYAIPQVPLAMAANRFGINRIVIVSYVVAIVCMFILPIVSVTFGWPVVLLIRFLKGLAGAAMYSIPIGMVDYWLPAKESTKAITLMMFIGNIGICLNPLISGYLTSIHWSLVFYVFASVGIIWLSLWMILVRDKPEQCWLMSKQELKLILEERPVNHQYPSMVDYQVDQQTNNNVKLAATISKSTSNLQENPPWKEISSDRNVFILIIIFIVYFGSYLSFINLLPTYFKNKMHLDIKTNALLTFLIQSASLFASLWGGALLSYLVEQRQWSTRRSRLTVSSIAALGSSLMWTVPYLRLPDQYSVTGFAINRALHPAMEICLIASVVERWSGQGLSGVMVSLYNCLGNFFSLIISAFSGYMLDLECDVGTIWANLFLVYAIINIISWMLFTIVDQKPPPPPSSGVARLELAQIGGQPKV